MMAAVDGRSALEDVFRVSLVFPGSLLVWTNPCAVAFPLAIGYFTLKSAIFRGSWLDTAQVRSYKKLQEA